MKRCGARAPALLAAAALLAACATGTGREQV
jgi:predicted small secreted protein